MNPHIINLMLDGYKERKKSELEEVNFYAHLMGRYTVDALSCVIGNMFRKKGSKPIEYPEKPYEFNASHELTEEEIQQQRQLLMSSLMVLKANYDSENNK